MSPRRTVNALQQPNRRPQRNPHVHLLTEREAADVCRYLDRGCLHPVRAFQRWARRAGMPVQKVGRSRLYDPTVLRAFLDRESWTARHRPVRQSSVRRLAIVHGRESVARPHSSEVPKR